MKKIVVLAAMLAAQPALAQETPFSGLRAEVRVGYETPTVSGLGDGHVYKLGNSASIGAEVGYDVPVGGKVAVGPFVNYDYAEAKDCIDGVCLGSNGNLLVGGRAGVALSPKVEAFFKLGYDRFRLKASIDGATGHKNLDGVGGELGINVLISQRAYAGFSIDYADLGSFQGLNFQRRHVAVSVGTRF
jgi:outer membrane immunogenic protein